MTFNFTYLLNDIDLSDLNMVINLQFKKNIIINLFHSADAKYFQALTNSIIRNNHLLQDSIIYLQTEGITQNGCTKILLADEHLCY